MMGRRLSASAAVLTMGVLAACGPEEALEPAPEPEESAETEQESAPEEDAEQDGDQEDEDPEELESGFEMPSIEEHVQNTEWLYSSRGLNEPVTIDLAEGEAEGPYTSGFDGGSEEEAATASYSVGEVTEGDLTGDGVDDALVQITAEAGDFTESVWYVWIGTGAEEQGEPVAEQLRYPVAAEQSCWDDVDEVSIEDGSIHVEGIRYNAGMENIVCGPGTEDHGGQTAEPTEDRAHWLDRTVEIQEHGDELFPVLTYPTDAWGGVCTGTQWHGGGVGDTAPRVAPPEDSPIAFEPEYDGDTESPFVGDNGYTIGYVELQNYGGGLFEGDLQLFGTTAEGETPNGWELAHQCYFATDWPQD